MAKQTLLFPHQLSGGCGTRLSIRRQDPNNYSDTEMRALSSLTPPTCEQPHMMKTTYIWGVWNPPKWFTYIHIYSHTWPNQIHLKEPCGTSPPHSITISGLPHMRIQRLAIVRRAGILTALLAPGLLKDCSNRRYEMSSKKRPSNSAYESLKLPLWRRFYTQVWPKMLSHLFSCYSSIGSKLSTAFGWFVELFQFSNCLRGR